MQVHAYMYCIKISLLTRAHSAIKKKNVYDAHGYHGCGFACMAQSKNGNMANNTHVHKPTQCCHVYAYTFMCIHARMHADLHMAMAGLCPLCVPSKKGILTGAMGLVVVLMLTISGKVSAHPPKNCSKQARALLIRPTRHPWKEKKKEFMSDCDVVVTIHSILGLF
jgi:hypothetical protein